MDRTLDRYSGNRARTEYESTPPHECATQCCGISPRRRRISRIIAGISCRIDSFCPWLAPGAIRGRLSPRPRRSPM